MEQSEFDYKLMKLIFEKYGSTPKGLFVHHQFLGFFKELNEYLEMPETEKYFQQEEQAFLSHLEKFEDHLEHQ